MKPIVSRGKRDFVPAERLRLESARHWRGAVGRQVALQLAVLVRRGCSLWILMRWKRDQCRHSGIPPQRYRRVKVLRDGTGPARHLNPAIEVGTVFERYLRRLAAGEAVFFVGVDSITARAAIWRSVWLKTQFWADGRMLGEVLRVLCVAGTQGRAHYPRTLFSSADAQPGRCTAHSTIYAAAIAAGIRSISSRAGCASCRSMSTRRSTCWPASWSVVAESRPVPTFPAGGLILAPRELPSSQEVNAWLPSSWPRPRWWSC